MGDATYDMYGRMICRGFLRQEAGALYLLFLLFPKAG